MCRDWSKVIVLLEGANKNRRQGRSGLDKTHTQKDLSVGEAWSMIDFEGLDDSFESHLWCTSLSSIGDSCPFKFDYRQQSSS